MDTLTLALRIIGGVEPDPAQHWEAFFFKPRPERTGSESVREYHTRTTHEIQTAACNYVAVRIKEAGGRG